MVFSTVRNLLNQSAILLGCLAASSSLSFVTQVLPAQAEGSRNLYPSGVGGSRAHLEWRTSTSAGILLRRTLLRVYAVAGERILVGSSAMGVAGVGGSGDIYIYNPGLVPADLPPSFNNPNPNSVPQVGNEPITAAGASFQCSSQAGRGQITTRAQELAGPQSFDGTANPAGYLPCGYIAPTTGIYTVVITGPDGFATNTQVNTNAAGFGGPGGVPADGAFITDANQASAVSAWDVTVRDSAVNSTADINGRLYTLYLALITDNNSRPVNSQIQVLTVDGFLYGTSFNGFDPNGFLVFGNRFGFLNSDGTRLERDIVYTDNSLTTSIGSLEPANPEFPIFFNTPAVETRTALGIPLPVLPNISGFTYTGNIGSNNSTVGGGGTFTYNSDRGHSFELVISRDGTDFDPTNPQNRVLRGQRAPGASTIAWDGLDNSGTPFPVGTNYPANLTIRAGDYHFPLIDVEAAPNGTPTLRLVPPFPTPVGTCPPAFGGSCTTGFYDDRGYVTSGGTTVGTLNQPLDNQPSGSAPTPPNSSPTTGFDTSSAQRNFPLVGSNNGFGDQKGLDLWTFFPASTTRVTINIVDQVTPGVTDLSLRKTVDQPAARLGDNVVFSVILRNEGPSDATGIEVTDRLPAGLAFVSATPSQGTYNPGTGLWSAGALANGATATLRITAQVNTTAAVINIADITRLDQQDTNPDNNSDRATIGLPNLRLVKRITGVVRAGSPQSFSAFVDDPSDDNDTAAGWGAAGFIPVGVPSISAAEPLNSGDEVTYTVYFLSDGATPTLNVNVCDPIPSGMTYLSGSTQLKLGATSPPTAGGNFFSPLSPLPSGNSCPDQNNANGSVIVDVGNISTTPGSNVGFIQFRVRLN